MTDREALEAARARWGGRAVVHVERTTLGDGSTIVVCSVGCITHDAHAWSAYGRGHDFRAAFDDADRSERAGVARCGGAR